MELSILTAKVLALTYLSAGLAAFSGRLTFSQVIDDCERFPGLRFLMGFIALVLGVVLVEYHNVWTANWTVLITIVGWTALIKGAMLIAFPQAISAVKIWYKFSQAWGVVMIALGLLFGYFGFLV